jgi:hypothetical protein
LVSEGVNGFTVDNRDDLEDLAQKIITILSDESLYMRMSRASRAIFETRYADTQGKYERFWGLTTRPEGRGNIEGKKDAVLSVDEKYIAPAVDRDLQLPEDLCEHLRFPDRWGQPGWYVVYGHAGGACPDNADRNGAGRADAE